MKLSPARRLFVTTAALAAFPGAAAGQADRREDIVRTAPAGPRLPGLAPAEARNWSLDISAIAGFDSNPTLTPEGDPRAAGAGGFVGGVANGAYRLYRDGAWTVTARGTAFWSKPFEAPGFSVAALRPSLSADYAFAAWNLPVTASFAYGMDATFVGGSFFDLGHALSAGASFPVAPLVTFTPSYTLSFIDFKEDARDAVRHRLGAQFSGPLLLAGDAAWAWTLGYSYTRNDARSGFFDFDQHPIAGGLSARLPPGFLALSRFASSSAELGLVYANADYRNDPAAPARRENIVSVSAAYTTPILPQLAASAVLVHRIADSNLAAFSTHRTTLTFALTWRF